MSKPWLTWAIDDPAPGNCGYSALNVPCEVDPSLRRGLVVHSVEGWFTYVSPSAVMAARGNSWGMTIMRSGQVWRHRPRPTFVNWHAGGPAQNIGTDGIEMEGKDQPWTPEQRASLVRVLLETQAWLGWPAYTPEVMGAQTGNTQESIRQALLGWGPGSLWEHNWFDYTSCPNGRNDWPWLMPALAEEDDMTPEEVRQLANAVVDARMRKEDDQFRNHVRHFTRLLQQKLEADLAEHRTTPHGGDSGISAAEARAIAQEEDGKLKVTK